MPALNLPERREIITTAVEHPATLAVCEHLERQGYLIHRIAVNAEGRWIWRSTAGAQPRVAVVSVMWANNETGVIFPVAEMAELAHEYGALFHCDAVQAVGKIPLAVGQTASTCSPARRINCTAERRRLPLFASRHALSPAAARRPSGAWTARRDGKYCRDCRHGRACELAQVHLPGMAQLPGCATICRTSWSIACRR
jgi:cysteine desulfurase